MKNVHLVIPDLFLPKDFAAEASRGLSLPALEKLLGRGYSEMLEAAPLENLLCESFGVRCETDAPIAPISAAFDGLPEGCWLRADPAHLHLQRDQLLLDGVRVGSGDAEAFCASLNAHFAGRGMEFFAPHPQRWYVRLSALPRIRTTPLSEVLGGNVRNALPTGEDAPYWNQLFNEIQMLLFAHPINEAREARGELPLNSLWVWGGGKSAPMPEQNHGHASSDEQLVEMFAATAGVSYVPWQQQWTEKAGDGKQLLVWTGLRSALQCGDLLAWRTALQDFEVSHAQPLWQALRSGKIAQLQLDVFGEHGMRRVMLKRGDSWAFWRGARGLAEYSMV